MFETTIEATQYLKQLGFTKFKESRGNFIYLLVPSSQRLKTIHSLVKTIPGAWHNPSRKGSSLGAVEINDIKIQIKPEEMQGKQSQGVHNELTLYKKMQQYLKLYPSINVAFYCENKELILEDIWKIEHVGATNIKNNRGDLIFSNSYNSIPISIKQDNSIRWCKAENYYGKEANVILKNCLQEKLIRLKKIDFYHKLSNKIVFDMSSEQKKFCLFGLDNAKVIIRTFINDDFYFNKSTKTLEVNVSNIFRNLKDVDTSHQPVFLLCNSKTRDSKAIGYRGLTLEAVMEKYVLIKNNVITVKNFLI